MEYETVECDSCGSEVQKEDARRFLMGKISSSREEFGKKQVRFEETPKVVTGWSCPYCVEAGPAGFPKDSLRGEIGKLVRQIRTTDPVFLTLTAMMIAVMIVTVVGVLT